MHKPNPIPDTMALRPFLVRDAVNAGVAVNRLRASDLARPFFGTRVTSTFPLDLVGRCRALAVRMPPAAFLCGPTAALLLGIPLPIAMEQHPEVHVGMADPARAPHAASIHGHRLQIATGDLRILSGIRLTSPARTWCDLAGILTLQQLVVAGDYLIFHERRLTNREQLAEAIARYPGRRGRPNMVAALALLHERSESPKESELRLIIVMARLPVPLVNEPVFDDDGIFLARPDFRFEDCRMVIEYEGDHHRTDKAQWRRDLARISALEAAGWYVMRVSQEDLNHREELVRKIIRIRRRLMSA